MSRTFLTKILSLGHLKLSYENFLAAWASLVFDWARAGIFPVVLQKTLWLVVSHKKKKWSWA
jgi:hypothetical protein